ncbi:glucosaminidase domain-containing protein [Aquimarina sp. W85]|uniref:glucosaminidase domain-containing protein n=1 Tax=Aquimarina rhodophyticola TaxID=3342246 RepID=UPI00366B108F
MRKVVLLIFSVTFVISCGSKRKAVTTSHRELPIKRKVIIPIKKHETEKTVVVAPVPSPSPPVSYKDRVENYIASYSNIAKNEMKVYGIPASITLAQGILESGAGYGELTQKANNHFGIKCHDWEGERVYHDDDLSQECFRKYDDANLSFRDHSLFLKHRKRYAKLFTYARDDYKSWAYGLRAAGYATDKKYPTKLIGIIERYQLFVYDREYSATTQAQSVVNAFVKNTDKEGYMVQKGDTLYSIAKKHKLSVAKLKELNNLKNNTIAIGQLLITTEDDSNEF